MIWTFKLYSQIFSYTIAIAIDSASLSTVAYIDFDGILGLAPSASSGSYSFVEIMKQQGIIDIASFSIDFRNNNEKSEIVFGGVNTDRVPGLQNFTFTKMHDDNSWNVQITSMKYGDLEFGGQAKQGIIDTGSTMLLLPTEDFKRWLNYTTYGKSCRLEGGIQNCACQSDTTGMFEPIYVTFDNYEYRIEPDQYMYNSWHNNKHQCYLQIAEAKNSSVPTIVLGHPFIRNYYIYHDIDNKRLGLHGDYMGSNCLTSTCGDTKPKNKGFIFGFSITASLFIAGLLICWCLLCFCIIRNRRKDEKDEKEEPFLDPKRDTI